MKIRIAVAGTGIWADLVHLPVLAAREDVDLVGVWGRDPGKTTHLAHKFGTRAFTRYEQAIDAAAIIDVAVSPDAQPGLAIAAATAGRHLLLEKPIAGSPAAATALLYTAGMARIHSRVVLTRLFDPERAAWLDRACLESWDHGHVEWVSGDFRPGRPFAGGWRQRVGPWTDIAPHVISQLEVLLGPVEGITRSSDDRTDPTSPLLLGLTHRSGASSTARVGVHEDVSATRDWVEVADRSTRNRCPRDIVNPRDAFAAAIDALCGDIRGHTMKSTRLDQTTLSAAVRSVNLIHSVPELINTT